jgi:ergothioneine biosynthesis protein EgtB
LKHSKDLESVVKYQFNTEEMTRLMQESRAVTHQLLFEVVQAEKDLRRQPAPGFRPILWHLGHVGAFESYWILQRAKGDASISPHYDLIFDPIKTPKDDSLNLPPVAEIEEYLMRVRRDVLNYLFNTKTDNSNPLLRDGYIFFMVLEHEYQHQETLLYLLQMLDPELKRQPEQAEGRTGSTELRTEMILVPGGELEIGSVGYPFAYDNEQPPHRVELADFLIDKYPVTNGEYVDFLTAGGYQTRSLWSEAGWKWKEENNITQPLYWSFDDGVWRVREMFSNDELKPNHPVTGVSWHEAEAYARFVGKRLPTEAEWEKAASWNPQTQTNQRFSWGDELPDVSHANFAIQRWGTTPVDAFESTPSSYGCVDMIGNVWEWTATVFDGYPGFKPFPYKEYSELWFDGDHRVLKGGSWATRSPILRCSFRNFWRPQFRIAFAGFRCAKDV